MADRLTGEFSVMETRCFPMDVSVVASREPVTLSILYLVEGAKFMIFLCGFLVTDVIGSNTNRCLGDTF